jgi:outer membrane lipoprotein SlyB
MKRTVALLACTQAVLLAACATSPERSPAAQAPAVSAPVEQPRYGVIESASVVSLSSGPSAAGGTTAPASSPTMAYRIRFDDGATQNVVQAGERFQLGERVQVTSDGRLVR